MANNIGGIISVEYCLVESINVCALTQSGIVLTHRFSNSWRLFPAGIGRINIQAEPRQENGSTLYDVTGEITCARHKFTNVAEMGYLENRKVLIKYTTANGDVLVAGDKENPITVQVKIETPSAASGFSGVRYLLSGVMRHPCLPAV